MAERSTALAGLAIRLLLLAAAALPLAAGAQSRVLFSDSFESGFGQWTVATGGGDASIGSETSASGRSMRLRWGLVVAATTAFDASAVTTADLSLWIRRGSDAFSENPETGDDLVIQYIDSGGSWVTIDRYDGGGSAGQIYTPTYTLPAAALHASARIRIGLAAGSGSDFDYWHVDDVVVTGIVPGSGGFGIGTCETFESGLNGWTSTGSAANVGVGTQTANSPRQSLFTRFGGVTAISPTVNLAFQRSVDLSLWIRAGAEPFSKKPEDDEDLEIAWRDSSGAWVRLDFFDGAGADGTVYNRTYALPAAALHASFAVRFSHQGSGEGYWHFDDICLGGVPSFTYRFEEDAWTGAGGEIEEDGGSGLDGTVYGGATNDDARPALATNPGTCRYGIFDGVNDYVEIPDDAALDMETELTASAWIYMRTRPPDLHTIVSKDWNYEFHINSSGQVYYWWNDSGGTTRSITSSQSIALNRWYHIAVTYTSGRQVIYVNGTQWAASTFTGRLRLNDLSLFIGTDWDFISRAFDGYIDEVHIAPRAYSQAEVQALRDATHPCGTAAAQFSINHDNYGIHCLPETVTVNVIDSVAGTPLNSYNAQVRLDTQSGNGTWSLVSGGGTFSDAVADDGIAYYNWPLGETQALFRLYYPQGTPVIDVDTWQVSDPGIRDTDAEGTLTFAPDGFTVTAAPISNPPGVIVPFASAQTAAVPFAVNIAAYGQTPNDPVCGVIESYSGNKNVKFWSDYVNPGTGFRTVDVDGQAAATAEGAAVGQVVAFVNGQAQVTLKYKDAGSIRLAMKDDTTGGATLPGGIRGGTAAFVSKPADFVLSGIASATGTVVNPEAPDASGAAFIAAGAPFRATVTALDAEGDPTPNFGRESTPASVELEPLLVAPAGGNNPAVAATTGFANFSAGTATATDFSWSEVGIVQLRPSVAGGDYLLAGDIVGTDSANVGRFVPDHFDVVPNAPAFATACTAGVNDFTYAGQGFGYAIAPMLRATAVNVAGSRTDNYTGAFFRMTDTTLANRVYAAAAGTLDTSLVPTLADDIEVTEFARGIATIRFDASGTTELAFARSVPEAPFNAAITLSIDVLDLDGVAAAANPVLFDGAGAGRIAFDGDGVGEIRYGRLRFVNAVGSERVDLPVPLVAEYFLDASSGFVPHADDGCTTGVTLAFVTYTENLSAGDTCVRDSGSPGGSGIGCAAAAPVGARFAEPPQSGDFGLRLAAPDATGSVIVDSTVPGWLRFDWNAALPGDENPAGIATFGLYGGDGAQIYLRELY